MTIFPICTPHLIILEYDQVKEDKISGACGTHGREKKYIKNFGLNI
jgi:hypothetical protein